MSSNLNLADSVTAVTMIARTSTDLSDFNNRCAMAFNTKGQRGFVFPVPTDIEAPL
ncbi:hypothetical protein CCP4SC76_7600006 [Gammaproteobacteria bacterium]